MKIFGSKIVRWICVAALVAIALSVSSQAVFADQKIEGFTTNERLFLIQNYLNRGFNDEFLEEIFYDQRLKKFPSAIRKNVNNQVSTRAYEDFTKSHAVKTAHRFSRRWRTLLSKASKKFNVDKEVLVAIFLIETSLGSYLGDYPVISVFSSILVSNYAENLKGTKDGTLSPEEEYLRERLEKKAAWADKELEALLKITLKTKQNPFGLKGSYAGAFGIPQFLPSSYMKWGFDSDKNGSVNIFLVPDAIYSTANYLNAHGWEKGLHLKSNEKVIWKYNNSNLYVNTVLSVAKKIRKISLFRKENI